MGAQVLRRVRGPQCVAHDIGHVGRQEHLVGIEHVRRVLDDGLGHPEQGLVLEHVVVVEEDRELARRHLERPVGGVGDAAVLAPEVQLDARVLRRVLLQHPLHVGLGGAVVRDAQLPLGIELRAHGFEHLAQHRLGRIERGHEHRDPGAHGHLPDALHDPGPDLAAEGLPILSPEVAMGLGRLHRDQLLLHFVQAAEAPGPREAARKVGPRRGVPRRRHQAARQHAQLAYRLSRASATEPKSSSWWKHGPRQAGRSVGAAARSCCRARRRARPCARRPRSLPPGAPPGPRARARRAGAAAPPGGARRSPP